MILIKVKFLFCFEVLLNSVFLESYVFFRKGNETVLTYTANLGTNVMDYRNALANGHHFESLIRKHDYYWLELESSTQLEFRWPHQRGAANERLFSSATHLPFGYITGNKAVLFDGMRVIEATYRPLVDKATRSRQVNITTELHSIVSLTEFFNCGAHFDSGNTIATNHRIPLEYLLVGGVVAVCLLILCSLSSCNNHIKGNGRRTHVSKSSSRGHFSGEALVDGKPGTPVKKKRSFDETTNVNQNKSKSNSDTTTTTRGSGQAKTLTRKKDVASSTPRSEPLSEPSYYLEPKRQPVPPRVPDVPADLVAYKGRKYNKAPQQLDEKKRTKGRIPQSCLSKCVTSPHSEGPTQ